MIVYLVENRLNGKRYAGKTVKTFAQRWGQHLYHAKRNSYPSNHFYRALRKHGADAFHLLLEIHCNESGILDDVERWVIAALSLKDEGYNRTDGGEGTSGLIHTPLARARMSAAQVGNKKCLGRKHSSETIAKMSAIKTGKKHSLAARSKMRLAKLGRKLSPEHCAKLSLVRQSKIRLDGIALRCYDLRVGEQPAR